MEPDNNGNLMTIDQLNDDCLLHVFKFLPIVDRIRAQRVCQRWYSISQTSWQTFKRISVERHLWGVDDNSKIKITRDVFKKVLDLCGRFITHVDLSFEEKYYAKADTIVGIQSCENVIKILHDYCKNVRYIHVGRPCSVSTVVAVGNFFKHLTHFAIHKINEKYEACLSQLFFNLRTLKYINIMDSHLTSFCFVHLSPNTIEQLHVFDTSISRHRYFVSCLLQFKNLRNLSLMRCCFHESGWISNILKAIGSNSETLTDLSLSFTIKYRESINWFYFEKLKNLVNLCLSDNILINNDVMGIIGNNCKKLKKLKLNKSDILTDEGMLEISNLPELMNLELKLLTNITDLHLHEAPKLKKLECYRCSRIRNEGLLKLIETSKIISMIKINCCENVDNSDFLDSVSKSPAEKLLVYIDTSEIEMNLILNNCLILKFNGYIMRTVKKLCYNCFKTCREDSTCKNCCDITEKISVSKQS